MGRSQSWQRLMQAHLPEALACNAGVDLWDEYKDSDQCLWTYDIRQRVWEHRQVLGLPEPTHTVGLAVADGTAYLLAKTYNWAERWQVYQLDLETWQCRRLPRDAQAPPASVRGCPVVVEASVSEHPCIVVEGMSYC